MKIFPIIPIWLMLIICIFLLFIILKSNKKLNYIIIIILLFIINLRIMIPSTNTKVIENNLDILFVIDNTISMNALDYKDNTTRLTNAKKDCQNIIKELNGARFSLITFDNTAKIITPYTSDSNITKEAINILEPIDELYAQGTSLNTPIETIITSLKSSKKKDNRIRILFFISDGEITNNQNLKSFKEISKYINNGIVLGYGTKQGGYIKIKNKYTNKEEYIMDSSNFNYQKAISIIDEKNLKQIANDINIEYINTSNQDRIKNKIKEIKKLSTNNITSNNKNNYEDTYYIFVIPLLILLIIDFNQIRRNIIWKKY